MFLSKIWFFLVAVAAAVALTIALVMPRPAQRALVGEEHRRLKVACGVINILLTDDARNRVELAGSFARTSEIVGPLEAASSADKLDDARMKQVRGVGESVMKTIQGRKPDFAILIDKRGRVVARVHLDENDYGDLLAGRPLVDDALAGYLRDDIWVQNGTMYFVTASPVIKRDPPVEYVGAVVLGHAVTNDLAQKLVGSLGVDVGFFLGNDTVAASKTITLDTKPMEGLIGKLGGDVTFVLSGSGHIAGVVNPPAKVKYQYWTDGKRGAKSLDQWMTTAKEHPGSWWPLWAEWLNEHSGDWTVPREPGEQHGAIEDAPGSYVKVKS